ncbi:carbamoyl-phosphate synthase large subunit [Fumia xinanensis]|uniref:Carbamoyl-phosphate synthase large subunit n=1 Tax=Fumia xinanensis TaxID=2763659 RepID=A0A926I1M9_9FIRM|nr:carbamoyl-phosphate synthase large subunit [Fumia xinanensis]MBC8558643.1 carbamoyl-phosphate synthase large subunit [Fumia xinanensis]
MPKREDIHKILIIGSGPIVIGQACEFDYSGTQACKALRKLGYEIVLVNSNPATIMTDPDTADVTYIEPLNVKRLTEIIAKERPDAVLPNLGGQTGLNLCLELNKAGVLAEYGVEVIGVHIDSIERGEDRIAFKETMNSLGIEMARSAPAYSVEEAKKIAEELHYPVVVRPAFTMGGAGGGLVYDEAQLEVIAGRGIQASMIGQVLIEESILGWEELELEVVRDSKGQMITVCFIENIDPLGVHTGDSFCAAPMLTISKEVQDRLQEQAWRIVDAVKVIGGTNVQFAHDPKTDRIVVIEINPRTSRSSALASKATGFPIALVSAMLAAGLTLDEIPCGKYGNLANYKPDGDYVVIKFARWAFEKFKGAEDKLGTQMRAVGEVMSIGKTFKEAYLKAIRSLEIGRYGLGQVPKFQNMSREELLKALEIPTSERQFIIYEALKKGASVEEVEALTKIKVEFLNDIKDLIAEEEAVSGYTVEKLPSDLLRQVKENGFSDRYLGMLLHCDETAVADKRLEAGILEHWDKVHVSGTPSEGYYYSTYHSIQEPKHISDNPKKVMILGGGPNRIGQGIEFDYCCVHCALALRKLGYETIMVNCNPETVSTDYDTSDKLYFEPLTFEDVMSIYRAEKPVGIIAQFGGQTPLNLARSLQNAGARILGTSPAAIDLAEDRDQFREMMEKLNIPMPKSGMAVNTNEALAIAKEIGYPLMVRPSYVLGGRGMEVVHSDDELSFYMEGAIGVTPDRPILIDRFLMHATEVEADAVCDGTDCFVPSIMQHIELAGIHSGDSACVLPPVSLSQQEQATIEEYTKKIALSLDVCGLMNMQFAIADGKVYVIEANPRASRTVPLVSKVCGINMVKAATEVIVAALEGTKSPVAQMERKPFHHFGVKEAVLPFNMFQEVDPVLGPEMRSTGEVLGLSDDFGEAFYKSQEATGLELPLEGTVLLSVNDGDKPEALEVAKDFAELGFTVLATDGTYEMLSKNGVKARKVNKIFEGTPHIGDCIQDKKIQLIINTPVGKQSAADDSYIRKAAIKHKLCYMTTLAAAQAAVKGIRAVKSGASRKVKSLQEFQKD